MPLHIAIDARRIRDFGIGTYIRSLVHALADIDSREPLHADQRRRRRAHASRVAGEFPRRRSIRAADSSALWITLAFPLFLHGLRRIWSTFR